MTCSLIRDIKNKATLRGLWLHLAWIGLAGCATTEGGVARGELYETGEVNYDKFFATVYQAQQIEADWSKRRTTAHAALTSTLGIPADSEDVMVLQALRIRIVASGTAGLRLVRDEAQPIHVVTPHQTRDDRALIKAIEDTARAELSLAADLGSVHAPLDKLGSWGKQLVPLITEAFYAVGPDKQDKAQREIEAALRFTIKASAEADRWRAESEAFVALLDLVISSNPAQ